MGSSILSSVVSLLWVICPMIVFATSCYYISKSKKIDAVLLMVGSSISLLMNLILTAMPFLIQYWAMPLENVTTYYSVTGVFSFIGGICFAIGFFILVSNAVKGINYKNNQVYNDAFGTQHQD